MLLQETDLKSTKDEPVTSDFEEGEDWNVHKKFMKYQ